nr:ribonuclease H-like domain-containing protein [Tanacetum cinerariifolium]
MRWNPNQQVLPSFEENTSLVTYPDEVEEIIGIPIEVEPLDHTKIKDLGLNTCSHDIFLSSREILSVDELEPQLLPNFSPLDVNLGDKRGTDPPIKPHSPNSFRMKVVDKSTINTPSSPHVAPFHPKDTYCYYQSCINDPKKHYGFKPDLNHSLIVQLSLEYRSSTRVLISQVSSNERIVLYIPSSEGSLYVRFWFKLPLDHSIFWRREECRFHWRFPMRSKLYKGASSSNDCLSYLESLPYQRLFHHSLVGNAPLSFPFFHFDDLLKLHCRCAKLRDIAYVILVRFDLNASWSSLLANHNVILVVKDACLPDPTPDEVIASNVYPIVVRKRANDVEGSADDVHGVDVQDDAPYHSSFIKHLDEVFLALGWLLEEMHVTWAHLEKKQTRLQTYTKSLEDLCKNSGWRRRHNHKVTTS